MIKREPAKQRKLQDCDFFTDEQKLVVLQRCNKAKEQMQAIRSRLQDDFFWRYFTEVKFTKNDWRWSLCAKVKSYLPPEVIKGLMETLNYSISVNESSTVLCWMGSTPEAEEHYHIVLHDPRFNSTLEKP